MDTWGVLNKKDDKSDEKSTPSFMGGSDKSDVTVSNNHIYFYCGVDFESALSLNKAIQEQSVKLINAAKSVGLGKPTLNIHINSGGGYIDAGTAIMDTISRYKDDIEIHTYVEGMAASAATFISTVGTKRFMTKNSRLLVHQLSCGMWGTYHNLKDHKENQDKLMEMIKRVYRENTKIPMEDIDGILEHDLFWTPEKCLNLGIIDEIV